MIARDNQPSAPSIEHRLRRSSDEEAPKTYRYEAIAELLSEARSSCENIGDESLACMVDAAYRICRACCCAWDEVEWHRLAYSKAHHRQQELRQELSALIDLISPSTKMNNYRQLNFHNLGETDRGQSESSPPVEYERLVQCIKDLLGSKPNPKPVSVTASPLTENTTEQIYTEATETAGKTPIPLKEKIGDDNQTTRPSLAIYFLSPFRVLLDEQPVAGWPNCKGKSIFKYLVTHREHPIPKEVLMEAFWPEGDPDAVRNNLNVAIYGLRKSLSKINTTFSYVLFQDDCYLLNPELNIWVDSEAFMAHVQKAKECELRGDQATAIHEYRAAEAVYQSEFLVEDRYEEWLFAVRQNFQDTYLAVMNRLSCHYYDQQDYETCVTMCSKTLAVDSCNEEQHRRLMRCYSLMGYTHLALRQYHTCRETLARELSLMPDKETMQLFEQIRQR